MSVNNVGYSTMTVTDTAKVMANACSPAMPGGAQGAVITVEAAQIRYRDDGTAPEAAEGHILNVGDVLLYDSWTVPRNNWKQVLKAIQFIRTGGTDGMIKISWYD